MSPRGDGAAPPAPTAGPAAAPRRGPAAEWVVLLLGVVGAVVVWAAFPSAGNYDTVLDLVWARELLDGHAPGFAAYAASTPHPAWLALGVPVVALFGDAGDRVMVLLTALSFAVLAAGTVRLGRLVGAAAAPAGRGALVGRWTGIVAGLLTLTSFAFGLLAVKGYLDVPFLALVTWAGAWAAARPERWRGPAVLLVLAGLLRPEAWVLAGAHWLWCTLRGRWSAGGGVAGGGDRAAGAAVAPAGTGAAADDRLPGRAAHLALVLAAPVLWVLMDAAVTGDPLHSLTATSALADELGRDRGLAKAPRLLVTQLVDQARPPVAAAGVAGALVLLLAPRLGLARPWRRVLVVVGALLLGGVLTFLAAGVGGLSLIPRYLSVPVVALTVLAALAATGWLALTPDAGRVRTAWAALVVVGAVLGVGAYLTVKRDAVSRLGTELRFLADARRDVRALIDDPAVVRGARCGPISLPTYRLVPEIRLQRDATGDAVLARSDPRARRLGVLRRGVAITVDDTGQWARRYGRADGVPRRTQAAPAGFRPVARSGAFRAWVRCPR
ncbi:hypothetical protein [Patulibacter sp. SYSU D01012]|uniref:hypothetical protein n=1 Tax=Patulibacter sp. SYSU D01012 TaxID=2817381 RepID=UPI001B3091FE|nr:hypothetical protein [Patulibacter sp. SYSU D01012]